MDQYTLIDGNVIKKSWIKKSAPVFISGMIIDLKTNRGEKDTGENFDQLDLRTRVIAGDNRAEIDLCDLQEIIDSDDFQLKLLYGNSLDVNIEIYHPYEGRLAMALRLGIEKETPSQMMLSWHVEHLDARIEEIFAIGRKLTKMDLCIIIIQKK